MRHERNFQYMTIHETFINSINVVYNNILFLNIIYIFGQIINPK